MHPAVPHTRGATDVATGAAVLLPQVLEWVLSYDGVNQPEPLAITAAAAALLISGRSLQLISDLLPPLATCCHS